MRKLVSTFTAIALLAVGLAWMVPAPASAVAAPAAFVVDSPTFDQCVSTARALCGDRGVASFSYSNGVCSFTCNPPVVVVTEPAPKPGPTQG